MPQHIDSQKIARIYSVYSGIYDFVFGGVLEPRIIEAIRAMGIKPGERVLEIGVGTGLSLPWYPPECVVTGIDLCAEMIAKSRRKVTEGNLRHVTLTEMNAEHLAFPNETFDHVFAAFVITTVPDPPVVLAEIYRVLKKGGQAVLLNNSRSHHPIMGKIEAAMSPLFIRLGWRTDIHVESILDRSPLSLSSICKVNKFDPWKIYFLTKNGRMDPRP